MGEFQSLKQIEGLEMATTQTSSSSETKVEEKVNINELF